jgi:hypothetical protein
VCLSCWYLLSDNVGFDAWYDRRLLFDQLDVLKQKSDVRIVNTIMLIATKLEIAEGNFNVYV